MAWTAAVCLARQSYAVPLTVSDSSGASVNASSYDVRWAVEKSLYIGYAVVGLISILMIAWYPVLVQY